jgi:uncharacterized protein (TIGR03118 family)
VKHMDDSTFSQLNLVTDSQTNLVSLGEAPAANVDPNLINPWGVSFPPDGPFWISDNGTGLSSLKDGSGQPFATLPSITIAAPPGQTTPSAPDGQVFNSSGGFDISQNGKTASSLFLFATEDGTISGWNPAVNAGSSVIAVDNSMGGAGAVYKGLAIAQTTQGAMLYAANFRSGFVEVYNSNFQKVDSFTDPTVPKGYAPFNVQVLDGHLYVTFALQDGAKHDDVAGAGHGFVDEFNLDGTHMQRVASMGVLNSPWGLAIAPAGFGDLAGDLLVGNFGNGEINAFNPKNDKFVGTVDGSNGKPIVIQDLWALTTGSGPVDNPTAIYFTAGLQDESHGLFGLLSANPEMHHSAMGPHGEMHHSGMA